MERPSKRLKRQNDKEPGFYAEVDSDDESDEKLDLLVSILPNVTVLSIHL